MQKYKNICCVMLVGISFYLFIESFYNVLVNMNAHVFMNFSDILIILPTLTIVILLILVEYFFFMSSRINKGYKPYLVIYIIAGIRLSTQFIILPDVILILNLLQLFSILIFFIGFIFLIDIEDSYMNFSEFMGAVIFGLGIQFIFLTLNISSSLTSDIIKISPTIAFVIILIIINNYLFYPNNFKEDLTNLNENTTSSDKRNVSLFHFIILGTLFIFSMMWIFNPMALSAYDIINLNINDIVSNSMNLWPSYGFTYYILLILITAVISYIIIFQYLFSLNQRLIRKIIISSVGITCILTVFALLIIENDITILSTIYLSIMTVIGVFSVVLYVSYLFSFYTFKEPKKLLYGIIIFFLTNIFFIILHVEILWSEYMSLIVYAVIEIITGAVLILFYELKNLKISYSLKEGRIHLNKFVMFIFICILITYGISLGVIVQERKTKPQQNNNPKLMIWNIHNAIGDDDIFHLDRLIEDIKENDPDILGLNEVDLGALKTASIDIPSYFAHKLNMHYFYGYTFYKHYGNVILSKYPILEADIIPLPLAVQSAEPRSLIRAKIEINSVIWTVFITHLSTESNDRLEQVPFIVNEIGKELSFEKIIWMGDLNLEPTSTEYYLINNTLSLNFTDSYRFLNSDPGYTGHFDEDHIPQKRIDYILCSPDLIPINSEVFCSIGSDHCAVITQF